MHRGNRRGCEPGRGCRSGSLPGPHCRAAARVPGTVTEALDSWCPRGEGCSIVKAGGAFFHPVFDPVFLKSSLPPPHLRGTHMAVKTIEELFIHELSDIYSAEKQLPKALPRLAKAAAAEELTSAFELHLEETQGQIERIDQVVELLGIKLKRIKCAAMEGLVEEGKEVIEQIEAGPLRDAALIGGAQKVEHYEIAAYGTL